MTREQQERWRQEIVLRYGDSQQVIIDMRKGRRPTTNEERSRELLRQHELAEEWAAIRETKPTDT